MSPTIDPRTDIGHVHLKVADLDRALGFWRDVLGFEEQARLGDQAAFISAGGYHHHIGLNTWESQGGSPPPPGRPGSTTSPSVSRTERRSRSTVKRVLDAGIPLEGASDHGVSEAIYLRDPDGNGVELYADRPREDWPRDAGRQDDRDVHAPARPARAARRGGVARGAPGRAASAIPEA